MKYWLMKTEPNKYSWDDLKNEATQSTWWEGVRNYAARNFMRDDMKLGDLVFFYHSSVQPQGIFGIAKVVKEAYPDHYSWNPENNYFDPKSTPENPRWVMVDIQRVADIDEPITLKELKAHPELTEMMVVQRGMRPSVQPVLPSEWDTVLKMRNIKL